VDAARDGDADAQQPRVSAFRRRGDLAGALRAAELRLALPAGPSERSRVRAELASLRANLD
jgi:hypothetical protein